MSAEIFEAMADPRTLPMDDRADIVEQLEDQAEALRQWAWNDAAVFDIRSLQRPPDLRAERDRPSQKEGRSPEEIADEIVAASGSDSSRHFLRERIIAGINEAIREALKGESENG